LPEARTTGPVVSLGGSVNSRKTDPLKGPEFWAFHQRSQSLLKENRRLR
jgi:hypothetical protein